MSGIKIMVFYLEYGVLKVSVILHFECCVQWHSESHLNHWQNAAIAVEIVVFKGKVLKGFFDEVNIQAWPSFVLIEITVIDGKIVVPDITALFVWLRVWGTTKITGISDELTCFRTQFFTVSLKAVGVIQNDIVITDIRLSYWPHLDYSVSDFQALAYHMFWPENTKLRVWWA